MQTKAKLGGIKERILMHRLLGASVGALAVFCLGFVFVPTLISEASAVQDVSVGANWVSTSLTLDPDYGNGSASDVGHGDIAFGDIIPTSTIDGNIGTERVIKKTIGIESSGRYYSVYLSMADSSSALKLNGDDSNIRINSVSGTWDSPAAFSATSWGYAVPNTPIPTSAATWTDASTPEYPIFSQATTFSNVANLGIDLTKNNNASVYNQDTWVAAPVLGSAQQIWKAETSNNYGFGGENGDSVNDHFDIYYGIMVGADTLAGTYENELVYTALASAQAIDEISNNLLVSERFVAEGTTETLKFDLASSQSGLIKPSQVYAYLVPHSDILHQTIGGVEETDEDVLVRLMANLAQDSSYYDTCDFDRTDSSTDIVFDTDGATITCEMPAETPVWDGGLTNSATATDGYYDIWIAIPAYNANYISKTTEVGTNNRVASVVYVGLQSVDENGDRIVTEMQQMAKTICDNTNVWNNQVGDAARILDPTGTNQLVADVMTTEIDEETGEETEVVDGAATSEASAILGIGSFLLTDNRDDKLYKVRRLADGNCWMAENLKINLADFAFTQSLTRNNTDINTDRAYWDPASSMFEYAQSIAEAEGYNGDPVTRENYFLIASEDLLGDAQTTQFETTSDSIWGTLYYDDTETGEKVLGASRRNNKYSIDIPREYITSGAGYYNWAAATAGSGLFDTTGWAGDSICPLGWQLPGTGDGAATKSYRSLLAVGPYGYLSGTNAQKIPFSFTLGGVRYHGVSGLYQTHLGRFWSKGAPSNTDTTYLAVGGGSTMEPRNTYSKTSGIYVRCVSRD
ncbi:hypothetical protein IJG98_02060 [Candidatus Saccharibacteria bacterium]|nr:hypothetical protein [Candidatus Saccharibacteria bacterium]